MTMQTMLEQMTSEEMINSLIEMMEVRFEDFTKVQHRCQEATQRLTEELETDDSPTADDVVRAIHKQIASSMLLSGFLGFRANWAHFVDPIAKTFLDVDSEIYLHERTIKLLPEYIQAQTVRVQFVNSLSQEQLKTYDAIAEYAHYLETVGPKLAHYYGYLFGNELFPRIVPGYCPDVNHTTQYRRALEGWLGITL